MNNQQLIDELIPSRARQAEIMPIPLVEVEEGFSPC